MLRLICSIQLFKLQHYRIPAWQNLTDKNSTYVNYRNRYNKTMSESITIYIQCPYCFRKLMLEPITKIKLTIIKLKTYA